MNYLRYSSDEMFSSTELIRKSKSIFDKLNKKQIEKAIILRDGKPGFMLLDFATYEKIMREFEKLSAKAAKTPKKVNELYLSLDDIEIKDHPEEVCIPDSNEIEEISLEEDITLQEESLSAVHTPDTTIADITKEEEQELSEITQIEDISSDEINDEELMQALAEIEKIEIPNNDENIESKDETHDLQINLDDLGNTQRLQTQEKEKSTQPLKEFWDN
ncbi:MAG: hypothetical protein HRT43_05160 [Campylobacteraceae bacterium]|nr:hypothetical protein [Campylobacteraceae bacterium]